VPLQSVIVGRVAGPEGRCPRDFERSGDRGDAPHTRGVDVHPTRGLVESVAVPIFMGPEVGAYPSGNIGAPACLVSERDVCGCEATRQVEPKAGLEDPVSAVLAPVSEGLTADSSFISQGSESISQGLACRPLGQDYPGTPPVNELLSGTPSGVSTTCPGRLDFTSAVEAPGGSSHVHVQHATLTLKKSDPS